MEIILIIIIAGVTFLSRIINLTSIPIFTDEAIYIRWAQIGLTDPAQRYIALTDGKQPLMTWAMYPFLRLFSDPLFAGRFVSVLTGIAACLGVYFVSKELFGRKAAVFSSLLYIISPFTLIYDKLALMDSMLAAFGIWSLYLEVLMIKKNTFRYRLTARYYDRFRSTDQIVCLFLYLLPPFFIIVIQLEK